MSTPRRRESLTALPGTPSLRRFPSAGLRGPERGGNPPAARRLRIDRGVTAFLDLCHFVDAEAVRFSPAPVFWPVLLALAALGGGCSSQPVGRPVEDSLTSGRISIVCAVEAEPVVRRQREAFLKLYPESRIEIRAAGSREAVAALFGARSDLAVITRDLETEERAAAFRGGLELEGFQFAADAIVVVVHESNPVENLAMDDLRAIYEGTLTNWSSLGGSGRVIPVVQPPASDVSAAFVQRVMGGEPIRAAAVYADGDDAVIARVRAERGAIGFVTLATPRDGVRTLRLAPLKALPYWKPDLEAVYRGDYPLTRRFHFYVRTNGARLAHGFITFSTSHDGQRLVQESGRVPTSVPVRFVRRSPMRSSH